jgi:hypothetical protein
MLLLGASVDGIVSISKRSSASDDDTMENAVPLTFANVYAFFDAYLR